MTAAELDIIVGANVEGAIASFKKLGYTITQTEQKAEKMASSSKVNFTGLNRVIQDLPFGFIAISNNLEQLLPAAGALGLAFSAVTATITFLQIGFRNWVKDTGDATKGAGELATGLELIASEAENAKGKMEDFSNSLEAMQKLWSIQNKVRFFSNDAEASLSDAKNNLAFVISEYNELSKAVEEASNNTDKALKAQFEVIDKFGAGSEEAKKAGEQFEKIQKIQFDLQEDEKKKLDELNQARSQAALGQLQFDKQQLESAKKLAAEREKARLKALEELAASADLNKNIKGIPQKFLGAIAVETGDILHSMVQKQLDKQPSLTITNKPLVVKPSAFDILLENLTATLEQAAEGALVGIGETIGNLISGQKNPFKALFDLIGNSLKALGERLIQYGIIMETLSKLKFSGVAAIAAGIALVALGQIVSNLVPKFATGGVVTKPTLALVGEQGPERITPLGYEGRANNNWMNGEVVFQISGQNLRGILRRADQAAFNTF